MKSTENPGQQVPTSALNAEIQLVVQRLRGRPRASYSPLGQWLRPLMEAFQKQGFSCRNVFLGLVADEDDGSLDCFKVSAKTAEAYRLNIAGRPVTWTAFCRQWLRVAQARKLKEVQK